MESARAELRVGVRELRSDLAAFLRRAEGGESIVVTISGRPAAVIGPVGTSGVSAPPGAPRLDDLVAFGVVVAPRVAVAERPIDRTRLPVDTRSDAELRRIR